MWKYKSVIWASVIFSLFSIVYCMAYKVNLQYQNLGIQHIFRDYSYMCILCATIIWQFQMLISDSYMFSKFSSLSKMLRFEIREMAIRLGIFFSSLGVTFLVLGIIYHESYTSIAFLFYRIFVLFCIFMVSYLILITSYHSSFKRNSIICFFCLVIMVLQIRTYGGDSLLSNMNPIFIVYTFSVFSTIKFLILTIVLFMWMQERVRRRGAAILYNELS